MNRVSVAAAFFHVDTTGPRLTTAGTRLHISKEKKQSIRTTDILTRYRWVGRWLFPVRRLTIYTIDFSEGQWCQSVVKLKYQMDGTREQKW